MLADFFTKPLQGALFRKFRDVILGYKHIDSLAETVESAAQERVGERPTDGVSTASDSQNVVEVEKTSWADVVAGRTGRNPKEHARVKTGGKENHRSSFTFLKQSR